MRLLLDASAIVPLILDYGERIIGLAARVPLHTIDLAVYETGNSLWKLSSLLKTIGLEDSNEVLEVLRELVRRRIIEITRFDKLDLRRIIKLATDENTTFYDASYIAAAETLNAVLVTEDKELRKKAENYVSTMTYAQLRRLENTELL